MMVKLEEKIGIIKIKMKRLKISFVPSWNFGDILNAYILYKKNVPFHYCHHDIGSKIIMIGSILSNYQADGTIVIGAGTIKSNEKITKNFHYRSIRGPLTYKMLQYSGINVESPIYGDPALLLPRIYTPLSEKKYKLGIIPHQVDFNEIKHFLSENKSRFQQTLLIDPTVIGKNKIESYIDSINSCEKILSTSLHGIVVAHAYGIPAEWLKFSNKLYGDDVKFFDHFESIGHSIDTVKVRLTNEDVHVDKFSLDIDLDLLDSVMPWSNKLPDDYYINENEIESSVYPIGYEKRFQDYWNIFRQ